MKNNPLNITQFKTIVIDGDMLAYMAAFPTQGKRVYVKNPETGEVIVDKPSIASCHKYLKKEGLDLNDFVYETVTSLHKNWEFIAKKAAAKKIKEWKTLLKAQNVILAFGGETNFRDSLPLLYQGYKSTRNPDRKPIKLYEIKAILKEEYRCEIADDAEADDIISMYQYRGSFDPGSYVVVTEDKDAKQTPGFTFNPRTLEIRDCSGFGEIELIVKISPSSGNRTYKIDGRGRCFFYYQVVCGDAVDSYSPFSSAKTPYRFYNEFKDIKTDKEAWQYVVNQYSTYFSGVQEYTTWDGKNVKGSWIDILETYVNVVHMHRKPKDFINVKTVLTNLGIDYENL